MSIRRALITGITGQDGSYLAELLLAKGYEVHGVLRPDSGVDPTRRLARIQSILDNLQLHSVSLGNVTAVSEILRSVRPDECYHLGAQTFVNYSSPDEFSTLNSNISGVHHLLSGIRSAAPECRFFFAGSSEMFGRADESPQNERTALHPRS